MIENTQLTEILSFKEDSNSDIGTLLSEETVTSEPKNIVKKKKISKKTMKKMKKIKVKNFFSLELDQQKSYN